MPASITNEMSPQGAYIYTFVDDCLSYGALDNDPKDDADYKENIIKRVISIAIPFLSLFRPFGIAKNILKNIFLIAKNGYKVAKARVSEFEKGRLILDVVTKVFFLVSALFSFTSGLYVCAGLYILTSAIKITFAIEFGEYKKAAHKFLDLIAIVGLIATMIFASVELSIAVLAFTIIYGIYKATHELKKGMIPETIARVAMACVNTRDISFDVMNINSMGNKENDK